MKADPSIIPGSLEGGITIHRRIVEHITKYRTLSSEAWAKGDFESAWLHRAAVAHFKRELAKHEAAMKQRFPAWVPAAEEPGLSPRKEGA